MRKARGGNTMNNELKEKILKIIEKNNKLTDEEVAVMLGVETEEVAIAVKELEVETVFLMSGGFDFMVQLKKAPMKEIALFVAKRLSVIDEVQSTTTHFVLKRYKDHGTLFVDEGDDKRMVLTP